MRPPPPGMEVQHHSIVVRLAHWLMALAILTLIGSGWRIYNSSPIFDFTFPDWITLGGDVEAALARHNDPGVATAIAWHFAAMWFLVISVLVFLLWGALSGHFRRDFLPVRPAEVWRDLIAALRFRLPHQLGHYNAVQKLLYWCALLGVVLMIASGLAIWKPVQTWPLEVLFGGFQGARIVHFCVMAGLVMFLAVHIALVILVPKTLIAMITGRASARPHAIAMRKRP